MSAAVMTLSLGRMDTNWYVAGFYSISNYGNVSSSLVVIGDRRAIGYEVRADFEKIA